MRGPYCSGIGNTGNKVPGLSDPEKEIILLKCEAQITDLSALLYMVFERVPILIVMI